MTNIMITGGTGFIGNALIRSFSSKPYKIGVLTRNTSRFNYFDNNISTFEISNDYDSLHSAIKSFKPDLVIHAATHFLSNHVSSDVNVLLSSNIIFPSLLLEAMSNEGINNFLNLSTTWQHNIGNLNKSINLYSTSKNCFQEILTFYSDNYNINHINLYLSDTYGINDNRKKIIQLLISTLYSTKEMKLDLSPGFQRLDLIHISDVISGIQCLIDLMLSGSEFEKNFQLSSDFQYCLREIVELIETISKRNIPVSWGSRPYRPNEVMQVPRLYSRPPSWFPKTSLRDGLTELIQIYE